jgi:DNA-binding transcriptional LysR family regulator
MRRATGEAAVEKGRDGGAAPAPTLDELHAFVHLARELHFGRAARRLGVARSSLSESIRRLEDKLEAVLFERTSRRVRLTDAGARLLPRARNVMSGVEGLRFVSTAPVRAAGGELRIGLEANGFAELTRPILTAFRARNPGISLVLREFGASPRGFFEGRLDAALTRSPLDDERLEIHEMAVEPRGVLVSADHPLAGSTGGSIVDFLDDPFVAMVPACRDYWIAQEHRGGARPRVGAEAFSLQDTLLAVAHLGLVTTAGRSIPRWYGFPGIGFAEVDDLSPVVLAVAVRAGEGRAPVLDFVELVREVVAVAADAAPDIVAISAA